MRAGKRIGEVSGFRRFAWNLICLFAHGHASRPDRLRPLEETWGCPGSYNDEGPDNCTAEGQWRGFQTRGLLLVMPVTHTPCETRYWLLV